MATFVYSCRSKTAPFHTEVSPCTERAQIRYLSDDDNDLHGCGIRRPQLQALLDAIESRDTLIVPRLQDLGHDAQEIWATLSLLLKRAGRIFVLQIGALDLVSPSGRFVLNTLDALAKVDRNSLHVAVAAGTARTGRRRVTVARPLRSAIVTDYSLGESISSLSRRYQLPRSTIAKLVCPTRTDDSSLPFAFGD